MGTTEVCPHCAGYMDIPDPDDDWSDVDFGEPRRRMTEEREKSEGIAMSFALPPFTVAPQEAGLHAREGAAVAARRAVVERRSASSSPRGA